METKLQEVSKWMYRVAITNLLQIIGVWMILFNSSLVGIILIFADYVANLGLIRSYFGKLNRNIDSTSLLWAAVSLICRILLLSDDLVDSIPIPVDPVISVGISSFLFGILILQLSFEPIGKPASTLAKLFGIVCCLFLIVAIQIEPLINEIEQSGNSSVYVDALLGYAIIIGLTKGIILPVFGIITFWYWGYKLSKL